MEVLIDFSDIVTNLVYGRGEKAGRKACPLWKAEHRAHLKSASVGGQWPQARLAKIPGWTNDPRCQLCQAAVGTLAHRHECPATTPEGGWPEGMRASQDFLRNLGQDRRRLLQTRGLFIARIRAPHRREHVTLDWLLLFRGPI